MRNLILNSATYSGDVIRAGIPIFRGMDARPDNLVVNNGSKNIKPFRNHYQQLGGKVKYQQVPDLIKISAIMIQ
jgi:hypothetical protein